MEQTYRDITHPEKKEPVIEIKPPITAPAFTEGVGGGAEGYGLKPKEKVVKVDEQFDKPLQDVPVPILALNQQMIVNGIIMSEILQPPRSRRTHRR